MVVYEKFIESSFEAVDHSVAEIEAAVKNRFEFLNDKHLFKLKFTLREFLNNAVEHGNQFDPNKKVYCMVHCDDPVLSIEIADEGSGIELFDAIRPRDSEPLLRERHRGYQTIMDMGFNIQIYGNRIKATLVLHKEALL